MRTISSASLTARSLRMSLERSLKRALGMASRIHAIQVQGHRLVDGDASVTSLSSSSIRATNSTSRSRDASICQMPSSWDFFAHGGHVARVRVQYAILTRDDRDMCLLGVEDVLEPVSQKRSLFARTMIASSVCSSRESLYLLYPRNARMSYPSMMVLPLLDM